MSRGWRSFSLLGAAPFFQCVPCWVDAVLAHVQHQHLPGYTAIVITVCIVFLLLIVLIVWIQRFFLHQILRPLRDR